MTDYAKPDSLPFRSYYAQQRRKKRKAANALVQRYITSLSAAGGMYYKLSEPVVIGDFEIELQAYLYQLTGDFCFLSDNTPTDDTWFRVDATNGSLDAKINGIFVSNDGAFVADSFLNTIKYRRIGSTFTAYMNDTVVLSRTVPDTNINIGAIGRRGKDIPNYFDGIISDLKIWTGGDRNTGTLVVDMPIDEDWKTSTDLHDSQGNVVGSAINVTENEADLYTLINDGTAWQSDTRTIPIAQ